MLRSVRSVRIFRALRRATSVTRLLDTLLGALPAVANVFMLLALLIYVYALLGMSFFGEVAYDSGPNQALNAQANFHTFSCACITLFRFSTGESWNAVMHDCMDQASPWAWLYFCSFQLIGSYLILNLLVAIVISRFQKVSTAVAKLLVSDGQVIASEQDLITPQLAYEFKVVWESFDTTEEFLDVKELDEFIQMVTNTANRQLDTCGGSQVPWPLGLGNPETEGHYTDPEALQALKDCIPLTADGRAVHYVELFVAMCRNAFQFDTQVTNWTGTQQPQELALKQFVVEVATSYPSIYAVAYLIEACCKVEWFGCRRCRLVWKKS